MKSKLSKIFIIFLFFILLFSNNVRAEYFTFDVNCDGKKIEMTSENPDIFFNIENFMPGDNNISYLVINNTGTYKVEVLMNSVEMSSGDNILGLLNLKMFDSEKEIYRGIYSQVNAVKIAELEPGETKSFKIETEFSKTAGNEYQNKNYKIKFNFEARGEEESEQVIPTNNIIENEIIEPQINTIIPEKQEIKKDTTTSTTILPKTGQASLWWVLAIVFITVIIIINKKLEEKYNIKINKRIIDIILGGAIVLFAIVVISVVKCKISNEDVYILGYKPYIVETGSMEPVIQTNGMVIIKKGIIEDAKVGDIINYKLENMNLSVCHRVVKKNEDGTLITKGDNNDVEDSYYIGTKEYVGKVIFKSNEIGNVISHIKNNIIYYSVIIVILIVAGIVIGIIIKKKN